MTSVKEMVYELLPSNNKQIIRVDQYIKELL